MGHHIMTDNPARTFSLILLLLLGIATLCAEIFQWKFFMENPRRQLLVEFIGEAATKAITLLSGAAAILYSIAMLSS